ncbi:OmpA family protein [Ferrimonas lipolytica]|uniref:OmpA family protein n=1 Tax=Ferrimonas lipolytica TaxID=2724191 RepID=A0A6H1UH77_9GAMM|nr:OmpA family protein [Ferrimonas lipolytica]QIZ77960.1 OmpA family protein [Ferrimonas lipolytica]
MMKHAVASALLLLAVPAMATNDINPWYAGVGLGHANWQGVCPDTGVGSTDCDDTDFAFDLFGGYRFNQNFGLELGYVDLGESDWNDDINRRQSNANGVRLGLIGTLPVNEQFAVNAELGGFYYDAEIETTTIDADDSGVQPYVGVGLNYLIDKNLEVGIRYRHFREMKTDTKLFNRHSVNYWGIQLSYHFGAKAKAAATPAPQPVAKPEPAPAPLVVPPPPKPKAVEVAPSTALYFDFNSSEVTGAELNKLTDIARYMEANPKVRAELIGHTDKMGDPDYNRALGMRRAQAVQQQLLQLVDISADRVVVQSKGESTASAQESRSERKVTVNLFGM